MELTPESLRDQIPYYLTKEQKDGCLRALRDFPDNINYYLYLDSYKNDWLQGDGWTKLQFRRFETGEVESVLGIVISNSCDISPDNKRDFPANITFAPLIPLATYVRLLETTGINLSQIQNKVISIKNQHVTNIFFLPSGGSLQEDHIVFLDRLYTIPARFFESEKEKSKVFSLSLIGFYMFLFKLSVHFCRFNERVTRA